MAIDATAEFDGSVSAAIQHFEDNPDDTRVVMVFSKAAEIWYQNSVQRPSEFLPANASASPAYLQMSFSSDDGMHVAHFRDAVDKRDDGRIARRGGGEWHMCGFLDRGVDDRSWLSRWEHQLTAEEKCHGAVVVNSASYRTKICVPGAALMKEAKALRARLEGDEHFKIFCLDPVKAGHGPNDLVQYLRDDQKEMNRAGWLKIVSNAEQIVLDAEQNKKNTETDATQKKKDKEKKIRNLKQVASVLCIPVFVWMIAIGYHWKIAHVEVADRSVFLIGPTGVGKSTLGNKLLGLSENDANVFKTSYDETSETTELDWGDATWPVELDLADKVKSIFSTVQKGSRNKVKVRVFDTPGLGDTKCRDVDMLDKIILGIKRYKPHGLIIVVPHGKIAPEFTVTMQAIAECLGVGILADGNRVALFVNKIMIDGRQGKGIMEIIVNNQRKGVSKFLGLNDNFPIDVAIGNWAQTWNGLNELKRFILAIPEEPMDVTSVRTFSEAYSQAEAAVKSNKVATGEVPSWISKRTKDLEDRVKNLHTAAHTWPLAIGTGVGGLALTAVAAVAGFVTAPVAAGAAGLIAVGYGGVYTSERRDHQAAVAAAELELKTFKEKGLQGQHEEEQGRLAAWIEAFKARIQLCK